MNQSTSSGQSELTKKLSSVQKLSKNFQKTSKNKIPPKTLNKTPPKNADEYVDTPTTGFRSTSTDNGICMPTTTQEYTYDTLPRDKNMLYNRIGLSRTPSTTLLGYKEAQDRFVAKVKKASEISNVNIRIFSDKLVRRAKPGEPNKDNIQFRNGMQNTEFDSIPAERVTGTTVQVPLRTAFRDESLRLDKNAYTALTMCGNLNRGELELIVDKYGEELTYNERAAIDLVVRAVDEKDPNAIKLFWELQSRIAQKTQIANQINIAVASPNAMMTTLLDQITDSIQNASETATVHGDEDVPPVTI